MAPPALKPGAPADASKEAPPWLAVDTVMLVAFAAEMPPAIAMTASAVSKRRLVMMVLRERPVRPHDVWRRQDWLYGNGSGDFGARHASWARTPVFGLERRMTYF